MSLSSELISQFVKATKDSAPKQTKTTYNATVVKYDGKTFVRIDGSDLLTPVQSASTVSEGDRVTVGIQDHTATVTGNLTDNSASSKTVEKHDSKINEFDVIIAYKVTAEDLEAVNATIESLRAKVASIDSLDVFQADIDNLQAKFAELDTVKAEDVEALNAEIENLEAKFAEVGDLTVDELEAINAEITNLKGYTADYTYVSADVIKAVRASVKELETSKLSVKDAAIKYANIDFSNIGQAAIESFYAKSGIIKDLTISEGVITGELVGVTIKGDLIEGGTVKADKLVVLGEDGLYYKLNFEGGEFKEGEVVPTDSLHGSVITAKSIVAEKISVDDLVAFDATIGGFNITDHSLYSGVKASIDNTTGGVYLDDAGQVAFGDGTNFIKCFKDADGNWKLELSANSIRLSASDKTVEQEIQDVKTNTIKEVIVQYALSDSTSTAPVSGWSEVSPEWTTGKYMWQRINYTYNNGTVKEGTPTCIAGAKGDPGQNGDGSSGRGVAGIATQFYLSISNLGPNGGEWTDEMPDWSPGYYLWTRTKITYTNPDSVEYTEPICDSSWEAINEIEIGARNLIRNSTTMSFKDYYFYYMPLEDGDYILDENGNFLLDENGNTLAA